MRFRRLVKANESVSEMEIKEILEKIRENEKDGMVVFLTLDGFMSAKLEEFIQQPSEGILYDLNRDKITTITLAEAEVIDKRWVNDYAVAVTIKYLHERLTSALAKVTQLEAEVEWLREAMQDALDAEELSDTHNIIYNALNSFQNGNGSNGDMTSPVGESEDIIAKTRLTYNANTITLEIKKADRGDYLLIQNLWQYSYYSTLEEAMENYEHKRDLFLGQGYVESEEE